LVAAGIWSSEGDGGVGVCAKALTQLDEIKSDVDASNRALSGIKTPWHRQHQLFGRPQRADRAAARQATPRSPSAAAATLPNPQRKQACRSQYDLVKKIAYWRAEHVSSAAGMRQQLACEKLGCGKSVCKRRSRSRMGMFF
jgi:hypothetical protein